MELKFITKVDGRRLQTGSYFISKYLNICLIRIFSKAKVCSPLEYKQSAFLQKRWVDAHANLSLRRAHVVMLCFGIYIYIYIYIYIVF